MKKSPFNIIVSLFVMLILFSLQGCSVVGFGFGAIADKKKAVVDHNVPPENISFLEPGEHIEVVDKAGIIYRGSLEKAEAIEIYTGETQPVIWLKAENRRIPVLLDNIDRIIIPGKKKNGKWVGLVVGAAVDAALITVITKAVKDIERSRIEAEQGFEDFVNCLFGGNCGGN